MRIVLTGGPCGGKTTLLRELSGDAFIGRRVVVVPEAAPILFGAGQDHSRQEFQVEVVKLQLALEDDCLSQAGRNAILLCHRGTLDALVYWQLRGWREADFYAATSLSRIEHYNHYCAVLHLETAARGAQQFYSRWPESHRPEATAQAIEIDELCGRAWGKHPRYIFIGNQGADWNSKSRIARITINRWIDG